MKFTCYKNDLSDVLKTVVKAVAVKPMTPILSGIFIRAEGNALELQANNYSTGIIARILANVKVAGETVVNAKRLAEFVAKFQGDMITCSNEDDPNILALRSNDSVVELLTMSPDEFPKVKTIDDAPNKINIHTDRFKDLLQKSTFAVSNDISRPIFMGVLFDINDRTFSAVATNTHRFACASAHLISDSDWQDPVVVPAQSLNIVANAFSDKKINEPIIFQANNKFAEFVFENFVITSRLLEGAFPPYDKIFLKKSSTKVTLDAVDFKRAIELAAVMSKETEHNTVKFHFADNNVEIYSTSPDIGEATANVAAEVSGDDLYISFNAKYILDFLKFARDQKINIRLNDCFSPAEFTIDGVDNFIYIVTPVRA